MFGYFIKKLKHPDSFVSLWLFRFLTQINKQVNMTTLGMMRLKGGEHVLEIDSGGGDLIQFIRDNHRDVQITSLNATEKACNLIRKRFRRDIQDKRLMVMKSAGNELPLPDESCDRVSSVNRIYFLYDESENISLQEIMRVLKPGGRIVIGYRHAERLPGFMRNNKHILIPDKEKIEAALRNAGFERVSSAYVNKRNEIHFFVTSGFRKKNAD